MLSQALIKINTQRKEYASGSLEDGVAEVLVDLCHADPAATAIIATSDKTLKDCGKSLYDYAKKNSKGGQYSMGPKMGKELICKFYDIPLAGNASVPSAVYTLSVETVSILDFLE